MDQGQFSEHGDLGAIVTRGHAAIEADDLVGAEAALDEARRLAGENHVRVLHLSGMLAWAQGDHERASGYLMQAADLSPEDADVYLDCAECIMAVGDDLDEAEAAARAVLQLERASERERDEARLLLAQIRLEDDDPEEAMELLDEVGDELQTHPAYLSTRGAVLMESGRADEAVKVLEEAVAVDPIDPDLRYQLGLTLREAGRERDATNAMLEVLRADVEDGPIEAPSYAETQGLRSRFEDVLEDLPEPLLRLVANAPITVQARATVEQVEQGADPRATMVFLGTRKHDDDDAELQGIVIMRDLLVEDVEDDEEIPDALAGALLDEIQRFFKPSVLSFGTGPVD